MTLSNLLFSQQLSLWNSEPLPKNFSSKFLCLLKRELIALQYATSFLPGDSCLQHTLCAKLAGYRLHVLATANSIEEAEELLFDRCLLFISHQPKDE